MIEDRYLDLAQKIVSERVARLDDVLAVADFRPDCRLEGKVGKELQEAQAYLIFEAIYCAEVWNPQLSDEVTARVLAMKLEKVLVMKVGAVNNLIRGERVRISLGARI